MIPKKRTFAVSFADAPIKYRLFRLTGKYKTRVVTAVIATVLVVSSLCLAFVSCSAEADGDKGGDTDGDVHVHSFEKASCTSSALCECGESEGEALGHLWHDATCTSPKTCARCKLTEGEPISHTWTDATCASPKTCVVCKLNEGEHLDHTYSDATCTSPRLCTLCGGADGEPLGHTFAAATCASPKTCARCGATEGDALGHKYVYGVCTVCNGKDPVFTAKINAILFPTADTALSRYEAVVALKNAGYTAVEADRILLSLNINWNEQALKYARNYVASKTAYSKGDLRDFMRLRGYTQEQIDYAVAIVIKEKTPVPDVEIADNDYTFPDFTMPGTWDIDHPWDYSTGNDFGGYTGKPIVIFP